MNERFIRCALCGYPHDARETVCPVTNRPIQRAVQMPAQAPDQPGTDRTAPGAPKRPKPNAWVDPPRVPGGPAPTSATALAAALHQDLIGATIGGKYRIRSVLGSGGMGTVFEAVHMGIGRQSAIKVLHSNQLHRKDAVRRFHQEARAAARIGHPNICEVYDLGTLEDGRPYLVMEKLVGETLADVIAREGGQPIAEVVDILKQVLSGLYAAHENGIIHRDIKPENVFLSRRVGCPPLAKLLDFGVSKMMSRHPQSKGDDGDLELTRTGIVLGTPYYLAPEQARGERNLDARVDLYACGVMLYEALTGRRPFVAGNYNALLIQILTGAPRPLREVRPEVSPDLERVVDKAMSRERHQRYASAVDFQTDLQQVDLRAAPSSRVPPRPSPSAPPPRPSHSQPPPAPPRPSHSQPPPPPPPASQVPFAAPAAPAARAGEGASRSGVGSLFGVAAVTPISPVELQLGSTRMGAPPAPRPRLVDQGPEQGRADDDAREQFLRALPVAPARGTPAAPSAMRGAPAASADVIRPAESADVDALIGIGQSSPAQGVPIASPAPPGGKPPASKRKPSRGFDDQPTEISLPERGFADDESTAKMQGEDASHIIEHARSISIAQPSRAEGRPEKGRETLLARRGADFSDDSKTEVMSPELRNRIRDAHRASESGEPPPGRGRPRK